MLKSPRISKSPWLLNVKWRLALGLLTLCMLLPAAGHASFLERLFAPRAELWEYWQAHEPADDRKIDHAAWDDFLQKYTTMGEDGVIRVPYANVSEADRASLQAYLEALAALPISGYSRGEQFAYWVNLYNALTVAVILDHYPVEGIRDIDISPGMFADGPWGKKLLQIEGEQVSLNDIEHRILRPIWQDPRIHYAVNCASIGCPNLYPEAYRVDNTERLLDNAARAYVNHPRGAMIEDEQLTVSKIYSWFIDDFAVDGGVLSHMRRYAEPELLDALAGFESPTWYEYDWNLNDQPAAAE